MKRCITCKRRIWPWQHYGFWIGMTRTSYWHARRCSPPTLGGVYTEDG